MAATYIAGGSLGTLFPFLIGAGAALDASIAAALPQIVAQVAGMLKLQAGLVLQPPSLAASAALAAKIGVGVSMALTAPSVAVNFSAIAAGIAELSAKLGSLVANLAVSVAFKAALGHAGLHLYSVEGEVGSMGSDLQQIMQTGLPGGSPTDIGFGVLLVAAADPGSIAVIKTLTGL